MQICFLNGSPRLNGNTAELAKPFLEELKNGGANVDVYALANMNIASCKGCYHCQDVADEYGCFQEDDMHEIAKSIIGCDLIVLATPIYTWFCTTELKAVLDRFYGKVEDGELSGRKLYFVFQGAAPEKWMLDAGEYTMKRFAGLYGMTYGGMATNKNEATKLGKNI